jgi:hypothetical protein
VPKPTNLSPQQRTVKTSADKPTRPPFHIPVLLVFVATFGVIGAFPGFMLNWHMDYVAELEVRELVES